MFTPQTSKPNFNDIFQTVHTYWSENHIFEQSIKNKDPHNQFRFYDGPPFVTGLPHYGHLASSVAKDVIPRYQTMKGKRVDRVWGWDCHGIPIEQKVQTKLGLESNLDIHKVGVEKFIEECYNYTRGMSSERKRYIDQFARWVDFDKSYKTMDNDYMESVWRVFKTLWDKGLIYKGKRVSMYSTKLETPISNFEVAMDDTYEDVNDPAITVAFDVTHSYGLPEGYSIELAQASDAKDIEKVRRETWKTTYIDDGLSVEEIDAKFDESDEKNIQRITKGIQEGKKYYVLKYQGDIVGIKYNPWFDENRNIHRIGGIYIEENHQGKGLGAHLMDISLQGLQYNTLGLGVSKNNTNALSFYESLGFIVNPDMADQFEFTPSKSIDVIWLTKKNPRQSPFTTTSILVWTTTPWTIPTNIAAGVHKDLTYVKVLYNSAYYIVAKSRLEAVFANKEVEIIEEFLGAQLVGLSYKPPFEYLYGKTNNPNDHKIYHADFVSDTDGTGIVHQAPEFGEVDFQLAKQVGLTITEAMDSSGHYTSVMGDKAGIFYRDANPIIIQELHDMGKLFHKASITHRVAFCPRSGTPLVYKAQDSWFIDINGPQDIFGGKSLKERCIEENEKINRYPAHNKHGRFLKSLESAPDRCISRTRFWGTPMPIYRSEDGKDLIAIGSREELYQLQLNGSNTLIKKEENGTTIYRNTTRDAELDMHVPYIDDVWFEKDGKKYTRTPEVLDSWMESASMPYAQVHYPFENKEKFEASFPADYIVEYTGQIRAWFYVMHVLGVALFDKPAFTNVVCHGVIAGNDGRKMSKSLGNFPDPKPTFEQYGGDAVRMSILTTPLFNGGDMSFSEELILEALKQNILPLWNAFGFFVTYANIDNWSVSNSKEAIYQAQSSDNRLDQWILGELQTFIITIDEDLANYDLTHSSRQINKFLENLTNWYIRRSRRRFRKSDSDSDKSFAYATLYTVLTQFCVVASPFMPIISEYIWRTLTNSTLSPDHSELNSVHLQDFPSLELSANKELSDQMNAAQDIVRMGLAARGKKNIRVRQPLSNLILGISLDQYYLDIIAEELNMKSVHSDPSLNTHVTKICKPDGKVIGQLFGGATKDIFALAKSGQFVEGSDGTVVVGEWLLPAGSYEISYIKTDESEDIEVDNGIVMKIDWIITPELKREGYARDLIRSIQDARKEINYDIADRIQLEITGLYAEELINHHGATIQEETLSTIIYGGADYDITKDLTLGDHTITLCLKK
ncbi:Isoleucine--tRNA ligase [candidate division SR1 bacterium Aalborg_AAW-1]|nr:Isoleucine--tRNA ligase [candidate division SR1 bacterium Aalborg_AAW-1]